MRLHFRNVFERRKYSFAGGATSQELISCSAEASSGVQGLPDEQEDVPASRERARATQIYSNDPATSIPGISFVITNTKILFELKSSMN